MLLACFCFANPRENFFTHKYFLSEEGKSFHSTHSIWLREDCFLKSSLNRVVFEKLMLCVIKSYYLSFHSAHAFQLDNFIKVNKSVLKF